MNRLSSMPAEARFEPPFRRVLAMDVGSRSLKLALVELSFRHVRVLSEQSLDLQAEGVVTIEEFNAQLQAVLEQLGRPPIALTLPQHLSTSQVLDLPAAPDAEVKRLIEEEIAKLSGASESVFMYDVIRLQTPARGRQQFWVTLCQERELRDQINRLGLEHEDICEITTTANGLIAAFRAACPGTPQAILVHAGAQNTVVVILVGGQGVMATSFATGGDYFTRAVATGKSCSIEVAETWKRTRNLFTGADALPEFLPSVDAWLSQVTHQLNDWFEATAHAGHKLANFRIVACGSALDQPGLLDYFKTRSGLPVERWPITGVTTTDHPARGFEVAFGTALHALRLAPQPVSLLPADRRLAWKKRLTRQWIDCASYALVLLVFLILFFGSWQKWRTWNNKQALQVRARQSLENLRSTQLATARLLTEYENWRPLLARQKMTLDTLDTLALLQQSRSNRNFWCVLLADQATYFTHPLPPPPVAPGATNAPAANASNAPVALLASRPASLAAAAGLPTNAAPRKPGFIAELCIAEEADVARRTFNQLVSELKQKPLFAKVDSLSGDLRRNLADPQVLLPARHFALALELAETEFLYPAPVSVRAGRSVTNTSSRLRPVPAWPDTDGLNSQPGP